MLAPQLSREMEFVGKYRGLDEMTILAQAIRAGVHQLYRETLIEGYLSGNISHEEAVKELGPEMIAEVEYQREAFARDVAWGMNNE